MLDYYVLGMILGLFLLSGVVMFSSVQKHLLLTLLSLEYVMLLIYLMLIFMISVVGLESYSALVFLVMAVSEGSLGLSILVSLVRGYGGDYFNSFNLLEW